MQDISLVWTRKEVESLARARGSWRLGRGWEGREVKAVCWEEHRAPAVKV